MAKMTMNDYLNEVKIRKQNAHDIEWLYIEINAKEFNEELEPTTKNLTACCKAMLDAMLEGDCFVVEPKLKTKVSGALTVRYYCDNLSSDRKSYWEVVE